MSRVLTCPSCNQKLKIPDAGGIFDCPGCNRTLKVSPSRKGPSPKPAQQKKSTPQPAAAPKEDDLLADDDDLFGEDDDNLLGDDFFQEELPGRRPAKRKPQTPAEAIADKKKAKAKAKAQPTPEPEDPAKSAKKGLLIGVGAGVAVATVATVLFLAIFKSGGEPDEAAPSDIVENETETPAKPFDRLAFQREPARPTGPARRPASRPQAGSKPPQRREPVNGMPFDEEKHRQEQAARMREMEEQQRLAMKQAREEEERHRRAEEQKTQIAQAKKKKKAWPLKPPKFERAQNPNAIERAREATGLLVTKEGTGSAFCVHESGVFVTNAHVVKGYEAGDKLSMVLKSGQDGETRFEAVVTRISDKADLAVVTLQGEGPFTELTLGDANELQETDQIMTFGFPFGEALALEEGNGPSISVNVGRVTSMRRSEGKLKVLQIDAQVNPGNSGGPVTTPDGAVVAVVVAGIQNSGVHFAIPVDKVREMLTEPIITFAVPDEMTSEEVLGDQKIRAVIAASPWVDKEEYDVSVVVKGVGEAERKIDLQPAKAGGFESTVCLVEPSKDDKVKFTGTFETGTIDGAMENVIIVAKDKVLRMKKIKQMTRQGNGHYVIKLHGSKKNIVGKLRASDLKSVEVTLAGDNKVKMDLTKAKRLLLPGDAPPAEIGLTLEVRKKNGDKVATVEHTIGVLGDNVIVKNDAVDDEMPAGGGAGNAGGGDKIAIGGGAVKPRAPEQRLAGFKKVQLPGPIGDVCFGAAGRYMICFIPKTQQAAVIDLAVAKVVKYIAMPASNVMMTAGLRKLVVALPEKGILSRYSLGTFRKELTKDIQVDNTISAIAMGNASGGPILVGDMDRHHGKARFYDLRSLKPINFKNSENRFTLGRSSLRASADGLTFAFSRGTFSDLHLLQIQGDTLATGRTHSSVGLAIPSPDGAVLHTSYGPLPATTKLSGLSSRSSSMGPTIPALHGVLYASLQGLRSSRSTKKVLLHIQGSTEVIAQLPDTKGIFSAMSQRSSYSAVSFEKRIALAPALGVVAFAFSDYVEVRPFDLMDILKKSGTDYLVVISPPVTRVSAGQTYQYAIKTISKAGRVRMSLDSGPDGMRLDGRGVLRWRTNAGNKGESYTVIVTVTDASGQETLHTFKVYCD